MSSSRNGRTRIRRSSIRSNGVVHAERVESLEHVRDELRLLLLQTKDVVDSELRLLSSENGSVDHYRDALHLYARTGGVLIQIEELIHIVERSIKRR